jgi:hypothetical protein
MMLANALRTLGRHVAGTARNPMPKGQTSTIGIVVPLLLSLAGFLSALDTVTSHLLRSEAHPLAVYIAITCMWVGISVTSGRAFFAKAKGGLYAYYQYSTVVRWVGALCALAFGALTCWRLWQLFPTMSTTLVEGYVCNTNAMPLSNGTVMLKHASGAKSGQGLSEFGDDGYFVIAVPVMSLRPASLIASSGTCTRDLSLGELREAWQGCRNDLPLTSRRAPRWIVDCKQ